MNLKQFKDLIENSDESQINLNEDVIYAAVVDDFCEKGDEMRINIINSELTIDGNGHAIDKGCIMEMHNSKVTFRNIHFKNNESLYIGRNSSISFVDCKFTHSKINNGTFELPLSITGCAFQKDCQIDYFRKLVLKNTLFENNSTYGEHMIKAKNIIIENCIFKNSGEITKQN